MIDFENATQEQIDAFLELMQKIQSSPMEMLKMNTMSAVYDLLDWTENRLAKDQIEFTHRRTGLEAQITNLFEQAQREIAQKCGLPEYNP